jgi:dihydroorotate dehydrogenase
VFEICKRTKEAIGDVPLIIKVGYYSHEQQAILENIVARVNPLVAAVSSINTIAARVVDEDGKQALPGKGRLKSGCCGSGIRWAGLDMVERLNKLREKHGYSYEIIGIGGVKTPDDYRLYRECGADCVQSATGAMWNPVLAQEIKRA